MGRLTFEGNFCDIAMCQENPCPYNGTCSQRETWERLKAYEDTGLEPETVQRLIRSISALESVGAIDHLKELTAAESDDRLVVLPCKVGDTVYVDFYGRIVETVVKGINIGLRGLYITTGFFSPWVSDLGKTWFFTREDAELNENA